MSESKCMAAWKYYQKQLEEGDDERKIGNDIMQKYNLLVWLLIKQAMENMEAYEYYLETLEADENEDQIKENISNKWDPSVLLLVQRAIEIDANRLDYSTKESY